MSPEILASGTLTRFCKNAVVLACFCICLCCSALSLVSADEVDRLQQSIVPNMLHLHSGLEREWSEFPDNANLQILDVTPSDDIRVGELTLLNRPVQTSLSESTIEIEVLDAISKERLPSRITVLKENGWMSTKMVIELVLATTLNDCLVMPAMIGNDWWPLYPITMGRWLPKQHTSSIDREHRPLPSRCCKPCMLVRLQPIRDSELTGMRGEQVKSNEQNTRVKRLSSIVSLHPFLIPNS
ncbi:MAG: hypothetical protein ABL921_15200 [Pirellula sp.]